MVALWKPATAASAIAGLLLLNLLVVWKATTWKSRRVCSPGETCHAQHFNFIDRLAAGRFYIAKANGEAPETELDVLHREALTRRAVARTAAGARPTVVRVGANDSNGWDELQDYRAYRDWSPDMLLVEPNPLLVAPLRDDLASAGAEAGGVRVVNAVVCESDGAAVSFEASLPSEQPEQFLDQRPQRPRKEKMAVRCLSPSSLLSEAPVVQPAAVDALNVDGEGGDTARILDLFLAVEGLEPAVVQFEYASMPAADQQRMLIKLSRRGYDLHVVGPNAAAVESRLPAALQEKLDRLAMPNDPGTVLEF